MDPVRPLVQLGFTELEAEIYTVLLEEPATTGYHLAKVLKKAAPNVYKALESLEAKGAVMVDEGRRRLCRAVPPEELLRQLDRNFRRTRRDAAKALEERQRPKQDQRVYQLSSSGAVLERARTMLQGATEVVLIDAFPRPVERLRGEIEAAARRGVTTALMVYTPTELAGVEVVVNSVAESTQERWPGQWLNLVVDGRECLMSFLGDGLETVHQALWSGSTYLSWVYHSALSSELIFESLARRLKEGEEAPALRHTLGRLQRFKALRSPGYREMLRDLVEGNDDEEAREN